MANTKDKIFTIKIGSSVLLNKNNQLNYRFLNQLAKQIQRLREAEVKLVLVISGAVILGRHLSSAKLTELPPQVLAGIGQAILTTHLWHVFHTTNLSISQILLTKEYAKKHKNQLRQTILTTIETGTIPVLNENDSLEPNCFGGNDYLAAYIASLIKSDSLIILSNTKGLQVTKNKRRILHEVRTIDKSIMELVYTTSSATGVGGMKAKLEAAKYLQQHGIDTFIAHGRKKDILILLIINQKKIGTRFLTD